MPKSVSSAAPKVKNKDDDKKRVIKPRKLENFITKQKMKRTVRKYLKDDMRITASAFSFLCKLTNIQAYKLTKGSTDICECCKTKTVQPKHLNQFIDIISNCDEDGKKFLSLKLKKRKLTKAQRNANRKRKKTLSGK